MKTKTILILCLLLGSRAAQAAFHEFNWYAEDFVLRQDSVDSTDPGTYDPIGIGDDLSGNVLYALYFTPGASTQELGATTDVGEGPIHWSGFAGTPGGDDRLVQVARANEALDGGMNLTVDADYEGNTLSSISNEESGYFYSVAFEFDDAGVDPDTNTTWDFEVPENTFAYITEAVAMNYYAATDTPTPESLSATAGGTWVGDSDGTAGSAVANTVLIPEPGTLLMALISGLSAVVILTFSRKKS